MQNSEFIPFDANEPDAPSSLIRNLTLGDILRRARVAKGLSLDDVARVLRIRPRQLQAMEADDFGSLPSAVHAKGLLRMYARHLDLDPERIVDLLDVDRYWTEPDGVAPTAKPISTRPSPIRRFLAALVVIVVVGGVGYFLARLYEDFLTAATQPLIPTTDPALAARSTSIESIDHLAVGTPLAAEPSVTPTPPASPTAATTPVTATPTPRVQLVAVTTPTATAVATATPTASAVEIAAEITGRVWLQVEVDGTVAFSGVLQPGDRRVWNGKQEIKLWAGRPQFINVIRNGKPEGPLGSPSEAGNVWTWTPS